MLEDGQSTGVNVLQASCGLSNVTPETLDEVISRGGTARDSTQSSWLRRLCDQGDVARNATCLWRSGRGQVRGDGVELRLEQAVTSQVDKHAAHIREQ